MHLAFYTTYSLSVTEAVSLVASTDCGCFDAETATLAPLPEAPPKPAAAKRWRGVLGVEGELTGDGRFIQPGALRWESLPIPLRYVSSDVGAHSGAQVVGRIDTIERDDTTGEIIGEGDFDLDSEVGAEAARVVEKQLQDGVSLDLDDVAFEVRVAADAPALMETDPAELAKTGEPDADGRVKVQEMAPDDEVMVTTDARVRAATIVAVPAFSRAKISLLAAAPTPAPVTLRSIRLTLAGETFTVEYDPEEEFNWVDDVGGLPQYIRRIADAIMKKGKAEGHAIAIAVNACKKMCATGDLNFPGDQDVNPGSRAEACAAVASWEEKKARARADSATTETLRDVPKGERRNLAEKGEALPDGSFPIANCEDLRNAIQAVGRAKDKDKARAHIKKRANALDCEEVDVPEDWAALTFAAPPDDAQPETKGETKDEQVRVPKGNPGGGQWMDTPASVVEKEGQQALDEMSAEDREEWLEQRNALRAALRKAATALKEAKIGTPAYAKATEELMDALSRANSEIKGMTDPEKGDVDRKAAQGIIDALDRGAGKLAEYLRKDWSLLDEDTDIGKGDKDITKNAGETMTLTADGWNPVKQLRVPKGNGRRSGRWIDMPWVSVDGFIAEYNDWAERVQPPQGGPFDNDETDAQWVDGLNGRMDKIKDLSDDARDLEVGSKTQSATFKALVKALKESEGYVDTYSKERPEVAEAAELGRVQDGLSRAAAKVAEFNDLDLSLLDEETDIGAGEESPFGDLPEEPEIIDATEGYIDEEIGIDIPPSSQPTVEDKILVLWDDGMTVEEIAAELGLNEEGVREILGEQPREPYALKAAAPPHDPDLPPVAFFSDPNLSGPTPLTITKEGRVYGHLATWGTCHISHTAKGKCVDPPKSRSGYAYFNTGSVLTKEGAEIPCGRITLDTGHAEDALNASSALAHYDNTGKVVADVMAGEDRHGIWVSGALRPGLSPKQVRALRSSPLSGDWRRIGTGLEMVAALAVNVGGFPVPRPHGLVASGSMKSLVAAGMLPPRKVRRSHVDSGALSREDLRYLKRLAVRERAQEAEARVQTLSAADELAQKLRSTERERVLSRARRVKVTQMAARLRGV